MPKGHAPTRLAARTNHGLVLQAQGQDLAPSPRTERARGSCPPQHNLPAPGASFPTNHSTSKLKLQIGIPEHWFGFFSVVAPFVRKGRMKCYRGGTGAP